MNFAALRAGRNLGILVGHLLQKIGKRLATAIARDVAALVIAHIFLLSSQLQPPLTTDDTEPHFVAAHFSFILSDCDSKRKAHALYFRSYLSKPP
jgi:hypothetical protein